MLASAEAAARVGHCVAEMAVSPARGAAAVANLLADAARALAAEARVRQMCEEWQAEQARRRHVITVNFDGAAMATDPETRAAIVAALESARPTSTTETTLPARRRRAPGWPRDPGAAPWPSILPTEATAGQVGRRTSARRLKGRHLPPRLRGHRGSEPPNNCHRQGRPCSGGGIASGMGATSSASGTRLAAAGRRGARVVAAIWTSTST
jgi:hypothetical protein